MKKLVIIGGEGHGNEITSVIKDNQLFYGNQLWDIKGFLFKDYVMKTIILLGVFI